MQLDSFTRAYVACALWSSNDNSTPQGGEPLDANYGVDDVHVSTLQEMIDDCHQFQADNGALLSASGLSAEQAGHDFWLTRNRHGAGYWDRGIGEAGEALTEAAHAWGSYDLYVGDDGAIHGS